jgi:hypothetical protein
MKRLQMKRSQIKIGWKMKIKKNTHFTINVLKRNIRTNFLFVILCIFVVMYIKYAIWDIKISKF